MGLLLLSLSFEGLASSFLPQSPAEQVRAAAGIFRGEAVANDSYIDPADGFIYTRTIFRVEEVFKGKLPARIRLVHRGGIVGAQGEGDGLAPQFKVGEQRLLFVARRPDGTLYALRGGVGALKLPPPGTALETQAGQQRLSELRVQTTQGVISGSDLTDQAASAGPSSQGPSGGPGPLNNPVVTATNLLVGTDGVPARFVLPDRGEPIPYLVDTDFLPAGLTTNQALGAIQSALAAWTNVTSLRYTFAGLQSFGQASPNVTNSDGILRIQTHDHYNYIPTVGGSDTLGIGGHAWTIGNLSPGWTTGGNVNGSDFHRTTRGYIVLAHTNIFMQNSTNFAEVLCHEIGHTLGLAHSSENPSEPDSFLKQAIMYYEAHDNGRGATISNYDIYVVQQVHPLTNTPPYCYSRVLDIVTAPGTITAPGNNTVQLRGYSLTANSLTLATTDGTANNGTFSLAGSNLTFTASAWFSDSGRLDPAGNSFWDAIYARYSDGLNASPYATIKVVSLNSDSYSEGIPDTWRQYFFGDPDPSAGPNRHATDDFDGDGFNNLTEWRLGSDPTSRTSNLIIATFSPTNLQWWAKGYEVYELWSSSNLVNWSRAINPIVPTNFVPGTNYLNLTNSIGTATGFANGSTTQFFRIQKVP